MKHQKVLPVFLLSLVILFAGQTTTANHVLLPGSQNVVADKYIRTELYFGMSKPDGGEVSESDWKKFLDSEVTPRFPAGLTVLAGYGQYKDEQSAKIFEEKSRVLILLYPKKDRRTNGEKIEQIRAAYKKQFSQQSVLRLDFTKNVEVSF